VAARESSAAGAGMGLLGEALVERVKRNATSPTAKRASAMRVSMKASGADC
jgi:hypothetical protein